MGRNGHDRTSAIIHQDEVGKENRYLVAVQRIDAVRAGENPKFFQIATGAFNLILPLDFGDKLVHRCLLLSRYQLFDHRMFGRQTHKGRTEQGIGTGGKNFDPLVVVYNRELYFATVAFADPVALHGQYPLRPSRKLVGPIEQFVGIISNFKEPLLQLLLFDQVVTAPAAAIFDLFVGENGGTIGTPVNS